MSLLYTPGKFGGLTIREWKPGQPLDERQTTIPRLSVKPGSGEKWLDLLEAFLKTPGVQDVPGLVIGWYRSEISCPSLSI